jgi:hypothetical protein
LKIVIVNQINGSRKEYLYSYGNMLVIKYKAKISSEKNHNCTFTVLDEKKGNKVCAIYWKGQDQL